MYIFFLLEGGVDQVGVRSHITADLLRQLQIRLQGALPSKNTPRTHVCIKYSACFVYTLLVNVGSRLVSLKLKFSKSSLASTQYHCDYNYNPSGKTLLRHVTGFAYN